MPLIETFGVMAVAITAVLVAVQVAGPRALDYRISDRGLEVMLFRRVPIRIVPLNRIVDVSDDRVGKWEYLFAFRLGNRFVGQAVVVRTRRPLLWRILITPNDPGEFVKRFRELTQARTGHDRE
jgi:hypothetical protein